MRILITGGSGSLGRVFIKLYKDKHTIISLTNNEYEHWELEKDFGVESILCDVRDELRLEDVVDQVSPDVIIHAAALKHLPYGERFPEEFFLTNVVGSSNVGRIAKSLDIEKAILISTDKSVGPISIYGRSKLNAEFGFMEKGYSAIRFGNFWGSRGSVIPLWQEQAKKKGYIEVTDPDMVRYFITMERASEYIMGCIENYQSRKLWTAPEDIMRKITLRDLAEEVCPGVPIRIIGNRGNEKVKEELQ